ncbi:DUF928 domain-containing protein [Moorena producens JHB]|uniref:DUF928 domain-containing protein n=1 Tax=Moorena producens (strain JHB) TaxID=1454205 RepID=A0A1D9G022_MOOP1|nr:DUF928 domain-containing protein [Moorena producens]AOY80956.1 DUF928 domain-containing protein [Moorena producens JHB]
MIWQQSPTYLAVLTTMLSAALVTNFTAPRLLAQSYPHHEVGVQFPQPPERGSPSKTLGAGTWMIQFPPVPERGKPIRTAGGGSRSYSCTDNGDIPLTAIVPANNLVKTVAANPTLFWYVPKTTATVAEFVLIDDQDQEVYLTSVSLDNTNGIVQLSLPKTVPLTMGKEYKWFFVLVCNPQERSRDQWVKGILQRTELSPELALNLEQEQNTLEQAKLYADALIWQETVTTVAQLRDSQPQAWVDLIKSVGLEAIANKAFVNCCTASN